MKKDIKKRWVAALRSGKFRQIKGRLRNRKNGRCCLGVLCDVVKSEVGGKWRNGFFEINEDDFSNVELPTSVARYCGFRGSCRRNPRIDKRTIASVLNDGDGVKQHSFREIADLIEKNL